MRDNRTVHNVLVLSPDVFEDQFALDNTITLHTYKLTDDGAYVTKCGDYLLKLIQAHVSDAEEFYEQINPA